MPGELPHGSWGSSGLLFFCQTPFFSSSSLPEFKPPLSGSGGWRMIRALRHETDTTGLYHFEISPLLEPRSTVTTNRRNHKVQWENTTRHLKTIFFDTEHGWMIEADMTKQFEQKDAKVAKQQMLPALPLRSSRPSGQLLVPHP